MMSSEASPGLTQTNRSQTIQVSGEKHPLDEKKDNDGEEGLRSSKRSRRSRSKTTSDGNNDGDEAAAAKPKKKKASKTLSAEAEFDTVWICVECKEAECMMQTDADALLICEGPCARGFHYPCAGLAALPKSDEPWICKDCLQQQHLCSLCQEYGKDGEDVFKCRKDNCGLFFHEACLSMHQVEIEMQPATEHPVKVDGETPPSKIDSSIPEEEKVVPVFTCPSHCCWTCTQTAPKMGGDETADPQKTKKKGKKGKKKLSPLEQAFKAKPESRLFRCLECPRTYHLTCIPPNSNFHELALLCHEHAGTHKLPDLDHKNSIQSSVENKIDFVTGNRNRKRRKLLGNAYNPFLPGIRGDRILQDEKTLFAQLNKVSDDESGGDYEEMIPFCLPCDLKDQVHAKPPNYKQANTLHYDPNNRPKKVAPPSEKCQCTKKCGEDCMNRFLMVECYGEGKASNCGVGRADCGNRQLAKRQVAKCKPQREQGKGWGLVTIDGVKKGQLVQEYTGEVINEEMKEKRLQQWTKEHPNDPNFYIMALPAGWYIDARHEANLSRFINHSCGPNCKLVTVNVKGYMRVGIYALRDIKPGEFLNYDYHFDTKHGDKFLCRCGAPNCRGTMKGGGQQEEKKKLNWKEAKARYDLDKKFLEETNKKSVISQVDALIPGAEFPHEAVSNGPMDKSRPYALNNRLFLWRNVSRGADFTDRLAAKNRRSGSS